MGGPAQADGQDVPALPRLTKFVHPPSVAVSGPRLQFRAPSIRRCAYGARSSAWTAHAAGRVRSARWGVSPATYAWRVAALGMSGRAPLLWTVGVWRVSSCPPHGPFGESPTYSSVTIAGQRLQLQRRMRPCLPEEVATLCNLASLSLAMERSLVASSRRSIEVLPRREL